MGGWAKWLLCALAPRSSLWSTAWVRGSHGPLAHTQLQFTPTTCLRKHIWEEEGQGWPRGPRFHICHYHPGKVGDGTVIQWPPVTRQEQRLRKGKCLSRNPDLSSALFLNILSWNHTASDWGSERDSFIVTERWREAMPTWTYWSPSPGKWRELPPEFGIVVVGAEFQKVSSRSPCSAFLFHSQVNWGHTGNTA